MIRDFTKKLEKMDPKSLSMAENEEANNIKEMIKDESIKGHVTNYSFKD